VYLSFRGNDVGYVATVQIGTPPRDFKILMDSGSADFWVGSENCQTLVQQAAGATRDLHRRKGGQSGQGATGAQDCGNHVFLGQESSSSFVDSQNPFHVTYGSGAVAGTIVTDNINVAGLALNNHTFGTAQQETVQFTGAAFDGLMVRLTHHHRIQLLMTSLLSQRALLNRYVPSFWPVDQQH
jgi:hypothetical protein